MALGLPVSNRSRHGEADPPIHPHAGRRQAARPRRRNHPSCTLNALLLLGQIWLVVDAQVGGDDFALGLAATLPSPEDRARVARARGPQLVAVEVEHIRRRPRALGHGAQLGVGKQVLVHGANLPRGGTEQAREL